MKRILFLVVFIVLCLSSASVFADSTDAKNWTGFYVGIQGSYNVGTSDWDWPLYGTHTDHILKGGMGGLFLGYNYQFPINVVVGVETDINYGKTSGSSSCPGSAYDCRTEVPWVGSTRVRAGYAVWRFLPYVAVGVAYSRGELFANTIATGREVENTVNTYWGWTPSIGLEFAITKNLLARAEYAYYDFKSNNVTTSGDFIENIDNKIRFQGFKFGLAWEFGGTKEASQQIAKAVTAEPPPPVKEIKKAPAAAVVVEQKMLDEGRARLNVEFDFNKSDVKAQYDDEIKNVADFMVKYPDTKVAIEGHTDSIGTKEYNQKLSQRRADSVKNYIVDKFNIDGKRLKSEGYGLTKPIADNKTAEGRQQNRRVESVLIK